jgi:hypothetical protein
VPLSWTVRSFFGLRLCALFGFDLKLIHNRNPPDATENSRTKRSTDCTSRVGIIFCCWFGLDSLVGWEGVQFSVDLFEMVWVKAVVLVCVLALVAAGTTPEGLKFLMENKAKEGVITLPSGLQYKVLKSAPPGAKSPKIDTPCECHYRGTLMDGTEFDSSYKRGKPMTFAPKQVRKCIVEEREAQGGEEGPQLWKAREGRCRHAAICMELFRSLSIRTEDTRPRHESGRTRNGGRLVS